MQEPFDENFARIADSMGIALYQRFSASEAALFLRCNISEVRRLHKGNKLNYIDMPGSSAEYFGYQLLEHLLNSTTDNFKKTSFKDQVDRIIRAKEVQELTGLSRTTLWRFENKGAFPRRVGLGASSVGWKLSEVQNWIRERQ